jgi:hypothetical protein
MPSLISNPRHGTLLLEVLNPLGISPCSHDFFFSMIFRNTARKVWLLSGAKDKNPAICMQDQGDLLFSCKVLD